jgi:hypothetical protein
LTIKKKLFLEAVMDSDKNLINDCSDDASDVRQDPGNPEEGIGGTESTV